jgi:hypothetical protein
VYLALDSCRLIVAVGGGTQRGTQSLIAAGDASSLCKVLLALLLSDLDLLFFAAAAKLIGLQQVLCLEGGAAMLGDVAVRHGEWTGRWGAGWREVGGGERCMSEEGKQQ